MWMCFVGCTNIVASSGRGKEMMFQDDLYSTSLEINQFWRISTLLHTGILQALVVSVAHVSLLIM